ncbi:MAG TPA: glycosyltransferase family 4 protein [Paracoccaceae bacterium]|nr:glycosyltransferase family 4 protein [Paracoccaceae bacterium]
MTLPPDTEPPRRRVVYAFPTSLRLRAPFHEKLRERLAQEGVIYDFVYSSDDPDLGKGDTVILPWAIDVPLRRLRLFGTTLLFQRLGAATRGADLVIVQQQNNLLANYWLQTWRRLVRQKIAFFGHGRNFQSKRPGGLKERFKRIWAGQVDWWFAYTEGCAGLVASYGFPKDRITAFNNAIDLDEVLHHRSRITESNKALLRQTLAEGSETLAVYVGGLYEEKRVDFLIESALLIRASCPDFHLIVIGGGPDAGKVRAAAAQHPWIHYEGPQFGQRKAELIALAKAWLMPGLVGLAVLDSFAYGVPMITTDVPFHSPEIDYLEDGKNGLIVRPADDPKIYAERVIALLRDPDQRNALIDGGRAALDQYSIENMVERFAVGVLAALEAPRRPWWSFTR